MEVIDSLFQPGHLVLAGGLITLLGSTFLWLYPLLHRRAMLNGSGKIVRMIIRDENAAQEQRFKEMLTEVMHQHEQVEEQKLKLALLEHEQKDRNQVDTWES